MATATHREPSSSSRLRWPLFVGNFGTLALIPSFLPSFTIGHHFCGSDFVGVRIIPHPTKRERERSIIPKGRVNELQQFSSLRRRHFVRIIMPESIIQSPRSYRLKPIHHYAG
jgi:hypothetical protein